MRNVLSIATVLGLTGVVAAFVLLYVGRQVLHLPDPQLQTLLYLKLPLAGHLTIFQTRTRGPWWAPRPSRPLPGPTPRMGLRRRWAGRGQQAGELGLGHRR